MNNKRSFKQYINTIKSSGAIGRAQYIIGNGNGPLLTHTNWTLNNQIYTQKFQNK